ncbi:DUF21 domain-containing protein, partial [bacterium]|nr:DUF21 domain-containing protein [bacterium]
MNADLAFSLTLLLGVLLLAAFFSASETALFSLRRADRERLQADRSIPARAALDLLARPRALLVAFLLVGVTLDAVFFSVSAGISHRLAEAHGAWAIPAVGALAVASVLLLGEVLTKAIATQAPRETALFAARTLRLVRNALRLVTGPLESALAR